MPKRRISKGRSAAQKAAQRKAAKASAAKRKQRDMTLPLSTASDMSKPKGVRDSAYFRGVKPFSTGKSTFLYHKTKDHITADAIIKGRKWISGAASMGGIKGHSQFTHGAPLERFKIGGVLLGVAVPRKLVKKARYEGKGVHSVSC